MAWEFLNPSYRIKGGCDRELKCASPGAYGDEWLEMTWVATCLGDGRERLDCTWKNPGAESLYCQLEIRIKADFPYARYLIPGVSVNGNMWGKGLEPKGLALEGEPWVFDYRRTSLPACTISENRESYLALMASNASPASLEASCSMIPQEDGRMLHRLLYPCIERPRTYCARDAYGEGHEDFLVLAPGEELTTSAYVLTGRPVMEHFGAANVEDAALDLLGGDFPARYLPEEVASLACTFAKRLVTEKNGRKLFRIGQHMNPSGVPENAEGYEFGWCGQNGMYARLFLERGFREKDSSLVETAVSNLDAWTQEAVGATGLIHTHYDRMLEHRGDVEDTCNLGFVLWELPKVWEIMRRNGIEKDGWLKAAERVADFLVSHYSPVWGFGKAWNVETGECVDPEGTIGAYVIPGLVLLGQTTGEDSWLEAARVACRFYRDRDLANFTCTAGALDTYCIDKETSGPLLAAGLALYEVDRSQEWLDCAKMAGWYFCSWMFHHDIIPLPDSDFARYGYRTLGGTSVSAQHHHIDPWGAFVVPQMMRLWEITGDAHWRRRGDLLWANAIQNIAPPEGKRIHGLYREAGAQNEGYHHCHWGDDGAPGYINEWLVAWPQAFCWNTASKWKW